MQTPPAQLERVRALVEAETGMDFSDKRVRRLQEAVNNVLNQKGSQGDLDEWLADPHERAALMDRLTAELTVGESFFFRNEHHFRALRECVVPEILHRNGDRREVKFWSAGCAGGEEPYSLAILLHQILRSRNEDDAGWSASILATDLNTEFLKRARQAEYRDWSFRRTEIQQDQTYFENAGDLKRLLPPVRDWVRFLNLNLVKDVYPSPLTSTVGLDLILFRNVAIYLQPRVVEAIVERFHRCLKPGGWLLLGEAEVSQFRPDGFKIRRFGPATFLQKLDCLVAQPASNDFPHPILPSVFRPDRTIENVARPAQAAETLGADVSTACRAETAGPIPKAPLAPPEDCQWRFDWHRVEQCLLQGDFSGAESELRRIANPRERARAKLKYVRRLLEWPQTARAREVLGECLREDPLLIDAHLLNACLAEERGDLAEAEASCRRALYLDRNNAVLYLHLALIQRRQGERGAARKSLELVQKLANSQDPNAIAEHGDGICYGRLSEMAQSMIES